MEVKYPFIEVFQAGKHTDSAGKTKTYTEEDLHKIADQYNSAVKNNPSLDAPIVKGHPTTNAPAYGWIQEFKVSAGKLYAKVKDLAEEFVDEIKEGRYKKRSIALTDDLKVRHVGFLGAVAPAVEGMQEIKFNEEEEYQVFEFASESDQESKQNQENEIPAEPEEQQNKEDSDSAPGSEFGIELRKDWLKQRIGKFEEYTSRYFADPVHKRFPIKTKSDTKATLAVFRKANVHSKYTQAEQQEIAARIVVACYKHGIKRDPMKYIYNKENNYHSFNNNKGSTMKDFIMKTVQWLTENATEEIATQFQAFADEYEAANPTEEAANEMNAEETKENAELNAANARISALEADLQKKEFSSYLDSIANKITPAMKDSALNLLILAADSEGSNYSSESEGENVKAVKALFESIPEAVVEGEFANNDNVEQEEEPVNSDFQAGDATAVIIEERAELDSKVKAYAKENNVDYVTALKAVKK